MRLETKSSNLLEICGGHDTDFSWPVLAEAGRDRSLSLWPSPRLGGRQSAAPMKRRAALPQTLGWGLRSHYTR